MRGFKGNTSKNKKAGLTDQIAAAIILETALGAINAFNRRHAMSSNHEAIPNPGSG